MNKAEDENELSLQVVSMMLNNEWEAVEQMLVKQKL
jgi:hypothetical protein